MQPRRVRLLRYDAQPTQFELAFAAPHASLAAYVREYVGWTDRSTTSLCRRELPSGSVPLIINFESSIRERKASACEWIEHTTFTAGLHDAFTLVESTGPGVGVQINFTALGARLFYDRPLSDFTNKTVELADVFGTPAVAFVHRLREAASWEARFDILDREIGAKIASARRLVPQVAWAWSALVHTRGRARIADLLRETGWSERHFAVQFKDHVGLSPKLFARVLRFRHAVRLLTDERLTLTDIGHTCGYFDQAHFTRDFRTFAGITPSELRESRLPDTGFLAQAVERSRV